ncbi:MAG: DUF4422 domain-containing protein, partial [Synergistaceae bacterium]|nr:DUF4422 domain-containing protein [Synergistaceae bacterium]
MTDKVKSVEVYVATHKKIDFALPDYCSKIQVNAERNGKWEGYLHDNDNAEDNISLKNPNYCELTALYSMWKNCRADIQGLCHYRRYFSGIKASERNEFNILVSEQEVKKACISQENIVGVLQHYDVILLNPDTPYITSDTSITVFEVFREVCYWKDVLELRNVIRDYYPGYLEAFYTVMNSDRYSRCNMFIAGRDFVNSYCTWLFDVLDKVEQRISLEGYNAQRARVLGYLSEILLNVYVLKLKLRCMYYCRLRTVEENICKIRFRRMLRDIPGVLK